MKSTKNIAMCALIILTVVMPIGAMAFQGEPLPGDILSIENSLSDSVLLSVSGRGLAPLNFGNPQGEAGRIILWDEAKNVGVISINESTGYGTTQFLALSVNSVDNR